MRFFTEIFPYFFMMMFFLVFGLVFVTVAREIRQWHKNNHSPRLIVDAQVVAKRTHMVRRRSAGSNLRHTYTTYFVTFQVESGDRLELQVQDGDFGLLVEGDQGRLTFQGTRFLEFQRT